MENTIANRLKVAMAGPPRVTQVALARACGIKAPSVSDWCRGVTHSIDGANLARAAEFLGVRAKWLALGVGPMRQTDGEADKPQSAPIALPPRPPSMKAAIDAIAERLENLQPRDLEAVASLLQALVKTPHSRPIRDACAAALLEQSALADKKTARWA